MSFIEGLSEKGEARLSFLTQGAAEGLSGAEVLRSLRDADLGYRDKVFYADYKVIQVATEKWTGLRAIPYKSVIDAGWYAETTAPLTTNFQTVVAMEGIDLRTGEEVTRYVTVSHVAPHTRRDIENTAVADAEGTSPDFEVTASYPVRGRQRSVRR